MTSNLKIQANRENALQSTKPKTQSEPKSPTVRRDYPKPAEKEADTVTPTDSADANREWMRTVGGSVSPAFNRIVIEQVLRSVGINDSDENERDKKAAIAAMIGIKPKDELEGMLAAQMVALHFAAMECIWRAKHPGQSLELRRENLNQANKLTRSYATLMESLDRHRGKGQQHVTVEHVHVNQGGQAIVGTVTPGGRGGFGKTAEQPHAKGIIHETGTPMPRPDSERKTVPIPGRKRKNSL